MVAIAESKAGTTNLRSEASFFARQVTPRIIAPLLVTAVAVRFTMGAWTLADLIVVGVMIAAQPFVEWMIHVFILHWKPKTLFGKTFDPLDLLGIRMMLAVLARHEWIDLASEDLARFPMEDEHVDHPLGEGFESHEGGHDNEIPDAPSSDHESRCEHNEEAPGHELRVQVAPEDRGFVA